MKMPTYERRFFILTFTEEMDKKLDESNNSPVSSGNGRRVTKISGESLKNKIKDGTIQ